MATRPAAVVLGVLLPGVMLVSCLAARRIEDPSPARAPHATRPIVEPLPHEVLVESEATGDLLPAVDAEETEALPAEEPARVLRLPELVRVGLATDLERVRPGCCSATLLRVAAPGLDVPVTAGLEITAGEGAAGKGSYRLQVAALKDPAQADSLAHRLSAALNQPADVVFDASGDLFKVRVGRYPGREGAEAAKLPLARLGSADAWIVHEDRGLAAAGLLVRQGASTWRVPGRTLRLESADSIVIWGERRYRGKLIVYLNDRGKLNVVNELPFEDYLRGVVPRELGPALYPELEALKAQAVAARTYALRNLGHEFAAEGFDVCATPRCQVYGGRDDEHPLSDRAVAETSHQILVHRGEPIDALYSATCGGHTERVEAMFPERRGAYLRPVPCMEAGTKTLRSLATPVAGTTLEAQVVSLGGAGVGQEVSKELFLDLRGDLLLTHGGGRRSGWRVGPETVLFAAGGVATNSLRLAPGDPLRLHLVGGRLAGVLQDLPPGFRDRMAAPRQARHVPWTRFRGEAALRAVVSARYPGFELRELEVMSRGASGRVSKLLLQGRDGRQEIVEGLAVRFTLDVPDNWFEVERVREAGRSGWVLRGRGWGHGVGLCQVGAFAMAQRGIDYRSILGHYYSDVTLEALALGSPASVGLQAGTAGAAPR
ncbi:MAG TPA: SpoIID/LytB domain-containing protein [Thermoanaerobaculia bacterium]|nr:SpoIID/LytB domain-containing protein [Thermoanaerobaculia bacterium]